MSAPKDELLRAIDLAQAAGKREAADEIVQDFEGDAGMNLCDAVTC